MKFDWLEQNWVPVYTAERREDKNKTGEFWLLFIGLWWQMLKTALCIIELHL